MIIDCCNDDDDDNDGLWSTHTFTKSYFSQLVLLKKINIAPKSRAKVCAQ